MTDEAARVIEPVRFFEDRRHHDQDSTIRDFGFKVEKIEDEEDAGPDPGQQPNQRGWDPEHRRWVDLPTLAIVPEPTVEELAAIENEGADPDLEEGGTQVEEPAEPGAQISDGREGLPKAAGKA